jgi:hypothetical protein
MGHIEKAEEKAAQVGEMSNTSSCPLSGREEFDEAENDNHIFGRDGEEEVDIDEPIWEEPAESQEDSVDCSRSPNDRNELVWGENHGTDACSNSTEKEVL